MFHGAMWHILLIRGLLEVVQLDRRQPQLADQVVEAAGQEVGCSGAPSSATNTYPEFLPCLDSCALLGAQRAAVLAQQPHRSPVQGDQPTACRGLRRPDRDQVAAGDAMLLDHRHPGIQVDVGPPQPGRFTAPQAAQRDQPLHHRQPIGGDKAQATFTSTAPAPTP